MVATVRLINVPPAAEFGKAGGGGIRCCAVGIRSLKPATVC